MTGQRGETFAWTRFHNKHRAAERRGYNKWTCLSQRVCYVNQEESDREGQVRGYNTCLRELVEGGGKRRRDHYLSAPGREAATFGRGGGAGGFKLNYSTKTKKKDTNDTNIRGDIQQNRNTVSRERDMGGDSIL